MYFEQFRSGTEEEYDDLKSLLEDITTFVDDMPVVNVVKQKEEQDKAKGLAMRKAAMETYTSKCACKNELFYRRFELRSFRSMVRSFQVRSFQTIVRSFHKIVSSVHKKVSSFQI